jgi:hypothetical protein
MKDHGLVRPIGDPGDLLLHDLHRVADLPDLIEAEDAAEVLATLERLFFRAYTYVPARDPDRLWAEPPVDLDACYRMYLTSLTNALKLRSGSGDPFPSTLLCVRLLPVLIGALLDRVDSGAPVLHDPMRLWCRGFKTYEFRDSEATLDALFPVSP